MKSSNEDSEYLSIPKVPGNKLLDEVRTLANEFALLERMVVAAYLELKKYVGPCPVLSRSSNGSSQLIAELDTLVLWLRSQRDISSDKVDVLVSFQSITSRIHVSKLNSDRCVANILRLVRSSSSDSVQIPHYPANQPVNQVDPEKDALAELRRLLNEFSTQADDIRSLMIATLERDKSLSRKIAETWLKMLAKFRT